MPQAQHGLEEELRAGLFQGKHEDSARESICHSKDRTGGSQQ